MASGRVFPCPSKTVGWDKNVKLLSFVHFMYNALFRIISNIAVVVRRFVVDGKPSDTDLYLFSSRLQDFVKGTAGNILTSVPQRSSWKMTSSTKKSIVERLFLNHRLDKRYMTLL